MKRLIGFLPSRILTTPGACSAKIVSPTAPLASRVSGAAGWTYPDGGTGATFGPQGTDGAFVGEINMVQSSGSARVRHGARR